MQDRIAATESLGRHDALRGSSQWTHRRTKVLYPHHFESEKNGSPQRGHRNLMNQFPVINVETIHAIAATNIGLAVPKSRSLAAPKNRRNGTKPTMANRLRFLASDTPATDRFPPYSSSPPVCSEPSSRTHLSARNSRQLFVKATYAACSPPLGSHTEAFLAQTLSGYRRASSCPASISAL